MTYRTKSNVKRAIATFMASLLFIMPTASKVNASEIVTEVASEAETQESTSTFDEVVAESVYEGENYRVRFTLAEQSSSGYNISVNIENVGDLVIDNWCISYDGNYEIETIWGAKIDSAENGINVIKNAEWNQDIAVGSSVEYGFFGKGDFPGFPKECKLIGEITVSDEDDYVIEYNLSADWESGFTGTINITNNGDTTLEDWVIEFDFDRTIETIWNGVIESYEENHYVIKGTDSNSNIEPGQTSSFGFTGKEGSTENEPFNYKLYSYDDETSEESYYQVIFDVMCEDAVNIPEIQTVTNGLFAIRPEVPVRDGYGFLGWYIDEELTQYYSFETMPVNSNITLYAKWMVEAWDIDTDEDGLSDTFEEIFRLDKLSADTDGDGLSDYIELDKLDTEAFLSDSDGDGIEDGEEDNDSDGLNNIDELNYGTDPVIADTDSDGLNDYEEINKYGTDPISIDTDGDNVSDGKEVEIGTDPLTIQNTFIVNEKADNEGLVKASVEIELIGKQVETLNVEVVENDLLFPDTLPGYIGEAYDFSVEGTFETATLNFEFDETLLNTENFDPVIYYFNEDEQQLEALETTVVNNVASAVTEHFSTYILVNRTVYEHSYEWVDVWSTDQYTGVEVVLIIDDSESMKVYDANNERLEVAKNLVDNLPENSKIGIVKFASRVDLLTTELTEDAEEAKQFLTTEYFKSYGLTYMY